MRRAGIALVIVPALLTVTGLRAQGPGWDHILMYERSPRDTLGEAARLAGLDSGARVRMWVIEGSVEYLFRMYQKSLDAEQGPPPDSVRPTGTGNTPVTYHIVWHELTDECVDSASSAPSTNGQAPACQRWRYAKDKKRSLQERGTIFGDRYVQTAVFTWFRREQRGDLVRLRVEVQDLGLSADWKRHTARARLTIESAPVREENR